MVSLQENPVLAGFSFGNKIVSVVSTSTIVSSIRQYGNILSENTENKISV